LVAGSLLLIPVKSSVADMKEMFSLNETGAFIWELIDDSATMETITQQVSFQYQIEVQRAQQDLSVFLIKLSDYIKHV
jgi:TusA-related sulfurtransferase